MKLFVNRAYSFSKVLLILCALIFLLHSTNSIGQRWDSLGPKTNKLHSEGVSVLYADSNYLYAAGTFNRISGIHAQGIARWNGIKWDTMGGGIDALYYHDTMPGNYPNNTSAITIYHNKLYVGGGFSSLGRVNALTIGTWNGKTWDSLPIQPFKLSYNPGVGVMDVINNKLYIGGGFDTIAGFPCTGIACWNDTNWSSLNFPNLKYFTCVTAICEYKGSIYVAGLFSDSLNDSISNVFRWDGSTWHSVGGGIKGNFVILGSMVVYKGELYLSGYYTQAEGNVGNNIQKWDGTTWSGVGGGTDYEIFNLIVYRNKLYAMGQLTQAGGISASKIALWDSTKWCTLGSMFDNTVETACIYKDSLYIGGGFNTIDGDSIPYIAEWTDGDYTANCSQPTGVNQLEITNEKVEVYPNPSSGIFQLEITNEELGINNTVEVYNVLGQQVYQSNINSDNTEVNLSGQPNGIYLYRVTTQMGELVGQGKVIVQR